MSLILASASTSRARVLAAAGIPFTAEPARIDEDAVKLSLSARGAKGPEIADALAEQKAMRILSAHRHALVLGADQLLVFEGEIVSKCTNLGEAARLLRRLRGQTHSLHSALVLARNGKPVWRHLSTATLTMRAFSDAFLERYLALEGESLLYGVGCYRLEGLGAQLFERVEGDYFSILGLPLQPLLAALREQGAIET